MQLLHDKIEKVKKKPKLVIHQLGLLIDKQKNKNNKLNQHTNRRRMSQIDLRSVLLHQQQQKNKNQQKWANDPENLLNYQHIGFIGRSISIPTSIHLQRFGSLQTKDLKKQKILFSDIKNKKNRQKNQKQDFLLPIIRNSLNEQRRIQRLQQNIIDEKQYNILNPRKQSLQLDLNDGYNKKNCQQNTFRKLKSQKLLHLQKKHKLQKAIKFKSKNKDTTEVLVFNPNCKKNQQNQDKNNSNNQPQISQNMENLQANLREQKNKKKFYISSINLDHISHQNQVLNKKNFILQLVQKRQKQMNLKLPITKIPKVSSQKPQNHESGYTKNPLTVVYDNSTISKKLIMQHPNQLILKKMSVSPQNLLKQQKYQKFITLNRSPSFKHKFKINTKDNINGWDIYKEYQENMLNYGNQLSGDLY